MAGQDELSTEEIGRSGRLGPRDVDIEGRVVRRCGFLELVGQLVRLLLGDPEGAGVEGRSGGCPVLRVGLAIE